MNPTGSSDAAELAFLKERMERIERRLDALEHDREAPLRPVADDESTPAADVVSTRPMAADWLPLLGRTLVIVGGAFVLRAVTEAGLLAPLLGSALGIVYAMVWFVWADRSAARGAAGSALWNGIAATIIAFPLLWETTVEFGILPPMAAGVVTVTITAVGLFVAWLRRLGVLAAIVSLASVTTLIALALGTRLPVPYTAGLLLLGLATLWIGYSREWPWLSWLVAVPLHMMIAVLTSIALLADPERASELLHPASLVVLQLGLVLVYVGTFAARTLTEGAEVRGQELTQGLAATVVGLGGAVAVGRTLPTAWIPLGLFAAVFGAAGYAVSFSLIDRAARRTNFIFYSSLALAFTIVAVTTLLPETVFAIAVATVAVLMALAGARWGRATLSLHGAVYAIGAAVSSGLLVRSLSALTTREFVPVGVVDIAALAALGAAIVYSAIPVATHGRTWGRLSRIPKLVVLVIAGLGLAGWLTQIVATVLPRQDGVVVPQALAVARTAVLAVAAVTLAWLGRHPRFAEASWLVYPVLVAGGVKLLVEDLRVGSPAILVASFALYGGALILAPRLARRTSS